MTVANKETFVFGVKDCKISKLLTDTSGGLAPTYEAAVDVPGIRKVVARFNSAEKELKGDDITIDTRTTVENVEVSCENAEIDLDVLPILIGGTTTTSGTTPNGKATWLLNGADRPSYFKMEAQIVEVDEEDADLHFIAFKAKVSGNPELGAQGDDYQVVTFSAKAIPCLSDDSFFSIVQNETAAAIS